MATGSAERAGIEVEGLVIEGWNVGDLVLGFAIAATILAVGMLAAATALKSRLVRT